MCVEWNSGQALAGENTVWWKPSEPGSLLNAYLQTQMWMGGEDYASGLISPPQLSFSYPWALWQGAGKGADLFAWQVWSACVHLHCLLARSEPGEGGVGWGRRLVSIRTQIGKRNQIYTSRNKLTKTRDNWLTLTIQASQAYQLRENMLLGGELINNLFPRPKNALVLPLGLLSSTNTQFLQFIATSHKVEWGGGDPWMGFISLWLPKIGCNI